MARSLEHCYCSKGIKTVVLVMVGLVLVGFAVGSPLHWRLKRVSTDEASCICPCDCSSEIDFFLPITRFINDTFKDCGKHNPELKEEMEKDNIALLSEELELRKIVANENLEHTETLVSDAKETSSHYQREAERCNARMDICEEGRKRAKKMLIEERKLSALWEKRARENGWIEDGRVYT